MPVLIRWRGLELRPDDHDNMVDNNNRVSLDGHVHQLRRGRVDVTSAPCFGTGQHDGWALDTRSGYVVAWRGITSLTVESGHFTNVLTLDGYSVIFGRDTARARGHHFDYTLRRDIPYGPNDWLATMGPLERGEVMLDARPPKSLVRRVRRARQAGAWEIPGTGLLLFKRSKLAEWPPPQHSRTPRARAGEGKNHPSNKRWSESASRTKGPRVRGPF